MALYELKIGTEVVDRINGDAANALDAAGKILAERGVLPQIVAVGAVKAGEVDGAAKARIEKMHGELADAGIKVNTTEQLFATGTRMLDIGYQNQADRKRDFSAMMPARDAAQGLIDQVRAEKRRDVTLFASELARKVEISKDGKVTLAGYALREQAIRGICQRTGSPALAYMLGLRERRADGDRDQFASVLRQELRSAPSDLEITLRTREALGDCFAAVSPGYVPADAPDVLAKLIKDLPSDARAATTYDVNSTQWEMRAQVFTPTPVDQQHVGEPFEAYASFRSRDNGTSRLNGGGGILILRCWNASTYTAGDVNLSRVHKGNILIDVGGMIEKASRSMHILCKVWGDAREHALDSAPTIEGIKIAREIALAGYMRGMLANKRSELAGVLPGRTETHVENLVAAYDSERRDARRLVKADLAQAFTRYVQDPSFSAPVRADATAAVGQWLANTTPTVDLRNKDLRDAKA